MSGRLPKDSFSIGLAEGRMDISTWTREAKMNIPVDVREDIDEIAEKNQRRTHRNKRAELRRNNGGFYKS